MILKSEQKYGRSSLNRIEQVREQGVEGARALLETFYYAFNNRDMDAFSGVWAPHELIQLNNPLGGILRGYDNISTLYRGIFEGPARVWVEFSDIVEFDTDEIVIFAGRETGEFTWDGQSITLTIRTSRIVQWIDVNTGWRQVHHHGSIDDPENLELYQRAVKGQVR
ncbi:MAG: nuclear transport factor 2 family protein [Candidatus Thiodiazotropha taylori]